MTSSPPMQRIGDFALIGVMGSDETGVLVRAHHVPSDSTVALRMFDADRLVTDGDRRVSHLVDTTASLTRHWPVAQIVDAMIVEDVALVATEFLPVGTLQRLDPLADKRDVATFVHTFARTLQEAGRSGVHHGSLSSRSIRIDRHGDVVMVDLGIAELQRPVMKLSDIDGLQQIGRTVDQHGALKDVWSDRIQSFDQLVDALDEHVHPATPTRRFAHLRVTVDADSYTFRDGPVHIGRDPTADVPIARRGVSREHLRLDQADGRWTVVDLDSKRGSRHQGRPFTILPVSGDLQLEIGMTEDPVSLRIELTDE